MSGLYIHIPFCKQACHYCDFHFSTNLQTKQPLVEAICKEIRLQKDYLENKATLQTIYFGGGTPSLLSESELDSIFQTIYTHFTVAPKAEITLEANPDDLTAEKLRLLRQSPVNRLSIGTQSFYEPHLRYMNRAHQVQEAIDSIKQAQDAGFSNISIDLIYGIPHPDHSIWENDLRTAINLQIQHISAYCLTIEPGTAFGNWLQKGKIKQVEEEFSIEQFSMLIHTLAAAGFEQYEISNFALPDYYSKHNSNYWKKQKYLGIGPSAHSYNGKTRQYNIANNIKYIKSIESATIPATVEVLSVPDHVNEYILTSLRTKWGCNLKEIKLLYDIDLKEKNEHYISTLLKRKLVTLEDHILKLTPSGKLLADQIASDLFIE
ncbi:radical SAM family heme chaperone HemW [Rhodocytophaga aerolata]|uniref:Heme chaperone HemW n=1 Tax=Rhodocytophaga aerolata TaxID=455078 RepID=A0ABT8R938_9BACT|nr:radical SAM family heme chaperone HemW [Rhodocytophaga aerolata]MDO1448607.1 radical SAM family heme chaperone HemW [Rhodocytophaga aerolata]